MDPVKAGDNMALAGARARFAERHVLVDPDQAALAYVRELEKEVARQTHDYICLQNINNDNVERQSNEIDRLAEVNKKHTEAQKERLIKQEIEIFRLKDEILNQICVNCGETLEPNCVENGGGTVKFPHSAPAEQSVTATQGAMIITIMEAINRTTRSIELEIKMNSSKKLEF